MTKQENNSGFMGVAIIGIILMIVGNFMPFVTVSAVIVNKSFMFIEGDGQIVLWASIISAVFLLANLHFISLLSCWVGAAVTFYDMANVSRVVSSDVPAYVSTSFGIGCYMIIIGVVMTTIALFKMSYKPITVKKPAHEENEAKGKFCSECGKPVNDDASFCSSCGKKLK